MSKYYYGFIDQFIDLGFICSISRYVNNDKTRHILLSYLDSKTHLTIEVCLRCQPDGSLLRSIKAFNNNIKIKDVSELYNKTFNDELQSIINIISQDNLI